MQCGNERLVVLLLVAMAVRYCGNDAYTPSQLAICIRRLAIDVYTLVD